MKKANCENSYDIPEDRRIVEVHDRSVKCDNDHPVVYYTIEKDGFAICGYCDIKYVYTENHDRINGRSFQENNK